MILTAAPPWGPRLEGAVCKADQDGGLGEVGEVRCAHRALGHRIVLPTSAAAAEPGCPGLRDRPLAVMRELCDFCGSGASVTSGPPCLPPSFSISSEGLDPTGQGSAS